VKLTPGAHAVVFSQSSVLYATAGVGNGLALGSLHEGSLAIPESSENTPTAIDTPEPVVLVRVNVLCGIDRVCPKG
jgi:hypothetical protein